MGVPGAVHEPLPARDVVLGRGTPGRRPLPNKARRMVGPWCFVNHYGPDDVLRTGGLWVPPHPYAGTQTITWLFDGLVLHTDCLGTEQLVRPGELNVLTAGPGVCRAEVTAPGAPDLLHGVQLWVALPAAARTNVAPAFTHVTEPPEYTEHGTTLRVLAGSLAGMVSPAPFYSPLVGAEVSVEPGARATLPVEPGFEHAVLVVQGHLLVDGEPVGREEMVYLGDGRDGLELTTPEDAARPAVLLLLGGPVFDEEVVLWWNFLAADHDEVLGLRADWNGDGAPWESPRFGSVPGFGAGRMLAPPMPAVRLRPRSPGG